MVVQATIRDPVANKEVLAFDQCAEFGQAFTDPTTPKQLSGELAIAQFGACPESLSALHGDPGTPLTDAEFESIYKGKIALYVDGNRSQWCEEDFFLQFPGYDRLVKAGALGIVFLDRTVGSVPGVWFGSYSNYAASVLRDETLLNQPLLPFFHCASNSPGDGSRTSDSQTINSFLSLYDNVTAVQETFPGGLNFTGSVTLNAWDEMWQSTYYRVMFQGLISVVYFAVFLLAMKFTQERFSTDKKRGKSFRQMINVPVVALQLEGWSCFILGLFLAIDGQWAVYRNPLSQARSVLVSQLTMVSMGSSVLLGLTFSDFKQSTKRLRTHHTSIIQRYRWVLIVMSLVFVLLEVLGGIMRRVGSLAVIINASAILISVMISVWFYFEARSFSKLLGALSASAQGTTGDSESKLRAVLKHTTKWIRIATIVLVLYVTITVLAVFVPSFLWSPDRFLTYFFVMGGLRALFSSSKIILLRIQRGTSGASTKNKTTMTNAIPTSRFRTNTGLSYSTPKPSSQFSSSYHYPEDEPEV